MTFGDMLPTSLLFSMVTALLLRRALVCAADALGAKPAICGASPAFCGASPGQGCGIKTSPVVLEEPPSADCVVSYEQLKAMLSSRSVQLFDVRNPDEFQAGHISGATNVPLGDLVDALKMAPAQFKQQFRVEAPSKQDENIVFHCQRGRRSATALEIAHGLGFTRARHYAGGYAEWAEREGGPSQ